jgi:hypothetical protein
MLEKRLRLGRKDIQVSEDEIGTGPGKNVNIDTNPRILRSEVRRPIRPTSDLRIEENACRSKCCPVILVQFVLMGYLIQ